MSINLIILACGILAIAILDTLGSLVSRKYKMEYAYLAFISVIIYFLTGFFGARLGNLPYAMVCCGLVGFFDATIGWDIAIRLSAHSKRKLTPANNAQKNAVVIFVTVQALVIGGAGCLLGMPS